MPWHKIGKLFSSFHCFDVPMLEFFFMRHRIGCQALRSSFFHGSFTAGKVLVDGRVINKAGTPVSEKSVVEIKAEIPKYVCR